MLDAAEAQNGYYHDNDGIKNTSSPTTPSFAPFTPNG
jgi:hypothetical protein